MPEDYATLEPKKDFFNVQFKGLETMKVDESLCIGWRYMGGDPRSIDSYVYDHSNIWKEGHDIACRISKEEAEELFVEKNYGIDDILPKIYHR